jgi:capsular polysaccharide biosynthesis protein
MAGNITVQKILAILWHRILFILAATAVMGLVFYMYTSLFITPRYSTSAMIFVQNYDKARASNSSNQTSSDSGGNSNSNTSNNQVAKKIFSSDISGSNSLATICVTLFQNSDEITQLYNGCSVEMTVNENTFYITIKVDGDDPVKCANVANQISEACINVYPKYFDYGQIGIIRTAKEPSSPYSPNKVQNALIGAAVGLILACVISILLELIDTTIKPDEDLSEIYKVPVFAEIPDFET